MDNPEKSRGLFLGLVLLVAGTAYALRETLGLGLGITLLAAGAVIAVLYVLLWRGRDAP